VAVFWNNYKELIFAPNPLFPELVSLGASGSDWLYSIARYPGRATEKWPYEPGVTAPDEEFSSYLENFVWSRIVAFYEFCHPRADLFLSRNAELVKRLEHSPFAFGILESYGEKHPSREDMFAEFLIFGMTYAHLLDEFGEEVTESFRKTMEDKAGFTMSNVVGRQLHLYLKASKEGRAMKFEDELAEISAQNRQHLLDRALSVN